MEKLVLGLTAGDFKRVNAAARAPFKCSGCKKSFGGRVFRTMVGQPVSEYIRDYTMEPGTLEVKFLCKPCTEVFHDAWTFLSTPAHR